MNRLTKNISNKQTYCGYEVKDCKYQQIYDFKRYNELEDYVDSDLTLAIDKLGKLEDLEEQIGCPLDVRCKVVCDSIIYDENGIEYKVVYIHKEYFDCEEPFDNDIGYTKLCAFEWKGYKKTWWLKENKEE